MNTMPQRFTPKPDGVSVAATVTVRAPGALRQRVLGAAERDIGRAGRRGGERHAKQAAWTVASAAIVLAVSPALLLTSGAIGRRGGIGSIGVQAGGAGLPGIALRQVGPRGELDISGMREPPSGKIYELWVNRTGGSLQPTNALFTVTKAGDATVFIPGPVEGLRAVAITAEPLGGSASPTSAPVLRVAVTR